MTTTTPKVSKSTFPTDRPSQQEWFQQFGVASGYTKPTPYYGGNEFNTEIFKRKQSNSPGGILSGIINILTNFIWAV